MQTVPYDRPGRQTMQNVKPTDYVPFEDTARTPFHLRGVAPQSFLNNNNDRAVIS